MAGIKISALPAVSSALTTDFFPVVQGGVTSKETLLQVQTLFGFSSGILSPAQGGTGVNNGANTITIGGNVTFSGAYTFVGTLTGATSVTFPTSGTLATVSGASGIVNSGLINQLTYYAATGTTVSGLATANNGTLITSSGGVPSISSTLPAAVQTNITALGTQSQAFNMGTHAINNVTDPVNAQDAATKNYVDNIATGGGEACYAATTAALTVTQSGAGVGATLTNAGAQAAFSVDGQSPPLSSRILVKNQSTTSQNGIYTLTVVGTGATNWVLTRAIDYDTPTDINDTGLIPVINGTVNASTGWYNTTTMVLVDTTAVTFVQFTNVSYPISLAHGGTNANLTASNGGIFYSTASAGAILSGTATAGQLLTSGASTTPAWTTSTYPATNAANTLLYASSANTMAALATANNSGLLTNGSGLPAWVTVTGTGAPVLATSPTLVTPTLGVATATSLTFSPTTGGIVGTTTNDNATAGDVGEFTSQFISVASAVSISANVVSNIASISLTAGDWDVHFQLGFIAASTTVLALCYAGVNTSISALNTNTFGSAGWLGSWAGDGSSAIIITGYARFSVSTTTIIYANVLPSFTVSTCKGYGGLSARRVR